MPIPLKEFFVHKLTEAYEDPSLFSGGESSPTFSRGSAAPAEPGTPADSAGMSQAMPPERTEDDFREATKTVEGFGANVPDEIKMQAEQIDVQAWDMYQGIPDALAKNEFHGEYRQEAAKFAKTISSLIDAINKIPDAEQKVQDAQNKVGEAQAKVGEAEMKVKTALDAITTKLQASTMKNSTPQTTY